MSVYDLSRSTRKDKRFMIMTPNDKIVHFGSKTGKAFIDHNDEKKKENWINRHSKLNEDWSKEGDETAGFWARWLLWNERTLKKSADDIKKRFGFVIRVKI
jgi:hypothetical protein